MKNQVQNKFNHKIVIQSARPEMGTEVLSGREVETGFYIVSYKYITPVTKEVYNYCVVARKCSLVRDTVEEMESIMQYISDDIENMFPVAGFASRENGKTRIKDGHILTITNDALNINGLLLDEYISKAFIGKVEVLSDILSFCAAEDECEQVA